MTLSTARYVVLSVVINCKLKIRNLVRSKLISVATDCKLKIIKKYIKPKFWTF
jgi:hypothetical protein